MTPAHKDLLQEFQDIAKTAPTAHSLMEQMAKRLHQKMTRYNWTGFYLVDPADSNYLIVGLYVGSFTPNARIPRILRPSPNHLPSQIPLIGNTTAVIKRVFCAPDGFAEAAGFDLSPPNSPSPCFSPA